MSDEHVRELERRWREGGRVEDEAAWLRELVRQGAFDPGRLRAAAYLGHPAAVAAVAEPPPPYGPAPDLQLVEWLRGLARADQPRAEGGGAPTPLGWEVETRVALALAGAALTRWEALLGSDVTDSEAAETFHLLAALVDHAERAFVSRDAEPLGVLRVLALDAWQATNVASEEFGHVAGTCVAGAANHVLLALGEADPLRSWGLREIELELGQVFGGFERVRATAARDVVPWALGRGDPVAKGVAG
ncbi:MAG: hypothetical protein R3F62_16640 [Planctomycetota bacterium]